MRLYELFDRGYKTAIQTRPAPESTRLPMWGASFTTDAGDDYIVFIRPDDENTATVSFAKDVDGDAISLRMTGTGDAYAILTTVMRSMFDYAADYHPDAVTFKARLAEPGRVRAYERMAKQMMPADYELSAEDDASFRIFTIRKK